MAKFFNKARGKIGKQSIENRLDLMDGLDNQWMDWWHFKENAQKNFLLISELTLFKTLT